MSKSRNNNPWRGKPWALPAAAWIIICLLCPAAGAFELSKGQIVFASTASGSWDLWQTSPRGDKALPLLALPGDEHSPAVSPGGDRIAFVKEDRNIRVLGKNDSRPERLPLPKGIYGQPAWEPSAKTLAFVRYHVIPTDKSEIWTILEKNGSWQAPEQVSTYPPMRLWPAYSPDGSLLAYTEFRRDKVLGVVEEIGIYSFSTKRFSRLTQHQSDSFQPVWSPKGDYIAYATNTGGDYNIWIISLDGTTQRQLTRSASYDAEPTWSPDGQEIAFVSTRTGNKEIWAISADGRRPRQITRLGATSVNPFWVK